MIKNIIFFLLLVPSVTFSLLPAEIFPYAFLALAFVEGRFLIFLMLFTIPGLVGNMIWGVSLIDLTISYAAFINASIPFFLRKTFVQEKSLKILSFYFLTIMTVMILQSSGVLIAFENIFKILIPRGSLIGLGGSRGVTGLSSEPSRAAYEFFSVVYVLLICSKNMKNNRRTFLIFFSCIIFITLNKSLTGAVIFLIIFIAYVIKYFSIKNILIFISLAILCVVVGVSQFFYLFPARISEMLGLVLKLDISTLYDFMAIQSYHRLSVFIKSLDFIFTEYQGIGFGNWALAQSMSSFPSAHIERVPYVILSMLEIGLLPTVVMFAFIFHKLKLRHTYKSLLPLFVLLVVVSDPGSPVIPLCMITLAIYLNDRYKMSRINSEIS